MRLPLFLIGAAALSAGCVPVRVVGPVEVVNPRVASAWGPDGATRWEPVPLLTTATGGMRVAGAVSASGAFQAWADFVPAEVPAVPPPMVADAGGWGGDLLGLLAGLAAGLAGLGWGMARDRAAGLLRRALGHAVAYGIDAERIEPGRLDQQRALTTEHAQRQDDAGVREPIRAALRAEKARRGGQAG